MAYQLDLFAAPIAAPIQTPFSISATPATQPAKSYTIEPASDPLKGFKVVLAPGLTTASPKNPCLTCPRGYDEKDSCSEKCTNSARRAYLEQIGTGLVSGVDAASGIYGIGA
jgi:hypothetical protein